MPDDFKFESLEEERQKVKTLFYRKINPEKMEQATSRVIGLLRKTMKLEPWECWFVIDTLYKSFPKESAFVLRKETNAGDEMKGER